jgi:catechol 2,3-dioxygenase-like lactoylglutathione lyase family enzyme
MHVHRFDHIHVYAKSPEVSVQFYESHFGAERVGSTCTTSGGTMYFLRLGGLNLVLAPYPPSSAAGIPSDYADGAYQGGFGVAHFGLKVDDVSAAVGLLRKRGVNILDEPRENGGLRFAYVGAPDGVIVELLQYEGGPWGQWLGASSAA